jgi:hypothetical protein
MKLSLMAVVAFFAIVFLATGVAAASSQYPLRHPKREHCRRGYVRVKLHRRYVCVQRTQAKAAPVGSLPWLVAHAPVAYLSEVLTKDAAPVLAEWQSKDRGPAHLDEQNQWIESPPTCDSGVYGEAYIECEKKAERHITWIVEVQHLVLCTPNAGEPECPGGTTTEQRTESHQYRATLTVTSEGSGLCGDLTFQSLLGSQWEYAEGSRARCNVSV